MKLKRIKVQKVYIYRGKGLLKLDSASKQYEIESEFYFGKDGSGKESQWSLNEIHCQRKLDFIKG